MKQKRTLIGVAAVLALAVIGVILLTGPEPQSPETAPSGATVAVPSEPAEPHPVEPAQATASSEPEAVEGKAAVAVAAPAPSEVQAPDTEFPQVRANIAQAPATPEPAQVAAIPQAAEAEAASESQPVVPQVAASPPSFDVVRVERSGDAVIAGRAEPGSEVVLRADDRILGSVTADRDGQWVIVLATPLEPGDYELSLESRLPGGEILLSENIVVVSVPQPRVAAIEPVAPSQPEVAALTDTVAQEAPEQPVTSEPAPDAMAVEPVVEAAPEAPAPAPAVAAIEPVVEPAPEAPAPAPQVAAVDPVAEAPVSAAPATEAEQPLAVLMPRSGEGQIRILQQAESSSGGLGEGTLILKTVDYDAEGRALVGGRAEANSRLIVYLDNKPAAQTKATLSGHWQATLARSIAPGLHTLRIDQLAGDGRVSARVETPFSRAEVLAALPSESAVIVQPGNSLWRISRRVYGDGVRYSVIYQANRDQIREPDLIYPGQILVVPTTD